MNVHNFKNTATTPGAVHNPSPTLATHNVFFIIGPLMASGQMLLTILHHCGFQQGPQVGPTCTMTSGIPVVWRLELVSGAGKWVVGRQGSLA